MSEADYRKTKVSALQRLAAAGDTKASGELARRGVKPAASVNVATASYSELRDLVLAWPTADAAGRELALQAQHELLCRWAVVQRQGIEAGRWKVYPFAAPPPVPPWLVPRPARCIGWQRPDGSTLYPSETAVQRARLSALAKTVQEQRERGRRAAEE